MAMYISVSYEQTCSLGAGSDLFIFLGVGLTIQAYRGLISMNLIREKQNLDQPKKNFSININ